MFNFKLLTTIDFVITITKSIAQAEEILVLAKMKINEKFFW